MSGRVSKAFFVIIVLLIGSAQMIPTNANASSRPVVRLSFDEGEEVQYADVYPGANNTVIFNGTVEAEMNRWGPLYPVEIELQAELDKDWDCQLEPSKFIISPGAKAPFSVEVIVPPQTLCNVRAKLVVKGRANYSFPEPVTYGITHISGTVMINQYHNFSLLSTHPVLETTRSGKVVFNLGINNEGNVEDIFQIEVVNFEELVNKGFEINILHPKFEVRRQSIEGVPITISLPDTDECLGKHTIEVKVSMCSENVNQEEIVPQTYNFTLKVKEPNFEFSTEFCIILIMINVILVIFIYSLWRKKMKKQKK